MALVHVCYVKAVQPLSPNVKILYNGRLHFHFCVTPYLLAISATCHRLQHVHSSYIFLDIVNALDKGKVCILFFDISKAFDKVWDKGLQAKFLSDSISGIILE